MSTSGTAHGGDCRSELIGNPGQQHKEEKLMKKIVSVIIAILIALAAVSITAVVKNKEIAGLEAKYASDIKAGQSQIDSLQSELQADKEILTGLLLQVDCSGEPVYTIGHKSPDSDTTASAIGMAYLLNELGITAQARIAGPLNLETEYALSAVGYPAPEILENAAGKQLWLVDHSDTQQMVDGADEARIVGITDHHGIGNAETSEPINVLSCPVGSVSALVFTLCTKCGVEIPKDVAGVLLAGVLSDTANMKSTGVTASDELAFDRLKEISGISDTDGLYKGMLEAKLSYKGMDDREIYYSDYKEYETNGVFYGIGVVKVADTDRIPEMSERMQSVIESEVKNGTDMDFLLFEVYDPDYSLGYMGFCGENAEFTEKLMDTVFGSSEEKKGKFYVSSPSLSRKTDVLPPIENYLNSLLP